MERRRLGRGRHRRVSMIVSVDLLVCAGRTRKRPRFSRLWIGRSPSLAPSCVSVNLSSVVLPSARMGTARRFDNPAPRQRMLPSVRLQSARAGSRGGTSRPAARVGAAGCRCGAPCPPRRYVPGLRQRPALFRVVEKRGLLGRAEPSLMHGGEYSEAFVAFDTSKTSTRWRLPRAGAAAR
jgi:hypothetical protein